MKRWSIGAKISTVSAFGALLGFSLCGGPGVVVGNSQTPLQEFASVVFVISCVGLLIGIAVWFVQGMSGEKK
jgi:hypothetical protein